MPFLILMQFHTFFNRLNSKGTSVVRSESPAGEREWGWELIATAFCFVFLFFFFFIFVFKKKGTEAML